MTASLEDIRIPVQPESLPGQKDLLAWSPGMEKVYLRQCNMCGQNPPVIYDGKEFPRGCPECGFNEFSLVEVEEGNENMPGTKAPPKPKSKAKSEPRPVLKPIEFEYTEAEIGVDKIVRRPNQPRKHFDDEKLEELARNIERIGLQQRIVVEPLADGYFQLIAGERRWRAFVRRDWEVIPARIVTANSEQKSLICLSENLLREDLSPIEEANSYQDTLAELGWTQKKLADELGLTQGQISNRIRLLKTPEAIQAAIISGEIDASVGRDIATWCDVPEIRDRLQDYAAKEHLDGLDKDSVFGALASIAWQASRPFDKAYRVTPDEQRIVKLEDLLPAVRKRLDIRDVPPYHGGPAEQRAMNVELWNELSSVVTEEPQPAKSSTSDSADPVRPLKVETEADESYREEELQDSLRTYLARWYWRIIALWIPDSDSGIRWRLCCYFGREIDRACSDDRGTDEELPEMLRKCGGHPVADLEGRVDFWSSMATVDDPETFACLMLARWADNQTSLYYRPKDLLFLEQIVKEFAVKLADLWEIDRDFLELFEAAELVNLLALDWKRKGPGPSVSERDDLINWALEENGRKKFPAPKCLTKLKLTGS